MSHSNRRQRSGRARRLLLVLLLLVVVLIAFLPALVAKTSLPSRVISAALPPGVVSVTCGAASCGWLTPPALHNLEVRDAAGEPLLQVESIQLDRTLLDLLRTSKKLGHVDVRSPRLYLRVRPDGSNLEDLAQALADPEHADDRSGGFLEELTGSTSFRLSITDGAVVTEDVASGQTWRTENVNVELDASDPQSRLLELTAAGRIGAGGFEVVVDVAPDNRQRLELDMQAVPVAAGGPWLRRYVDKPELGGVLSAQATMAWTPATDHTEPAGRPPDLESSGNLAVEQFDFSSAVLAGDHLRLPRVDSRWQLQAADGRLAIQQLDVRSQVGQLSGQGAIAVGAIADDWSPEALTGNELQLQGNLDLAQLAALLPQAMRIREDTNISSGDVNLTIRSRPIADGARVSGSLQATELTATSAGRQLRWDAPVKAIFDASWQDSRWRMDALECRSDFCEIFAAGDRRQLQANAQVDLDRLAEQLGQFVDLSQWRPSGTGNATLSWKVTPDARFVADGNFRLQNFALAVADRDVWREPNLTVTAKSAGEVDAHSSQVRRVDSASLQLRADGDSLDAALRDEVDLDAPRSTWPLAIRATGNLDRWLARVRPLVTLDGWQVDGQLDMTAELRVGEQMVEVSQSKLQLADVLAVGNGWRIDEPRVELSGDWSCDLEQSRITARNAELVSSSASLAVRDVELALPENGPVVATGMMAVRADVGRLGRMRTPGQGPAAWQTAGMLTGNLQFASRGDSIGADLDLQASELSLASHTPEADDRYQTVWQEPQLTLRGAMSYGRQNDRLALDRLRVQSETLQVTTSGSIEQFSAAGRVDLTGTVDYDLARVTPLLKPYLGGAFQLSGRDQASFQLTGELAEGNVAARTGGQLASSRTSSASRHWSQTLEGRLQAPWRGAELFGLPIGPGQIVADLGGGSIRLQPLDLSVGEGRLTTQPLVRLDPEPAEIVLPEGQTLSNVFISRQVSDALLKYIAPVLANATRSEGTFGLRLDSGRIPLAEPGEADIAGQLRMQEVDVVPGRATEQWVGLAQRVKNLIANRDPQALVGQPPPSLLRIEDRTIPFRVVDGRVYHEEMEFYVGEAVVRTQGSVGLDQSLEMMVRMPVLDSWVDGTPALSGLRGTSIDVPVTGTLSRPQVDAAALTALSTQLLRDAARGALGGEINKALKRLFGE